MEYLLEVEKRILEIVDSNIDCNHYSERNCQELLKELEYFYRIFHANTKEVHAIKLYYFETIDNVLLIVPCLKKDQEVLLLCVSKKNEDVLCCLLESELYRNSILEELLFCLNSGITVGYPSIKFYQVKYFTLPLWNISNIQLEKLSRGTDFMFEQLVKYYQTGKGMVTEKEE